jgi:sugar lactone lactonase YvrE
MWLASLGAAAGARAAACGWYPVCPYTVVQTLGDTDPASLEGPLDVAVTPGGDVLVADLTKESVREFDASGQFIRQIGAPGSFQYVDAVAVDQSSGEIWVADQTGVHGFSPTGTLESEVDYSDPEAPVSNAYFPPAGIAIGPTGNVYAFDYEKDTVHEYSSSGVPLSTLTVPSTLPAGFPVTVALAVDGAGNLYVAADGFTPVMKFDPAGTEVATLGPDQSVSIAIYGSVLYAQEGSGPGAEIDAYDLPSGSLEWSIPGLDIGQVMTGGSAVAAGASGIFVAAPNHSIQRFGLDGSPVGSWGSLAIDDYVASSAVADVAGNVYVADSANSRIIRYDAQGDPPTLFADLSAYGEPSQAALDSRGDLVVRAYAPGATELVTLDQAGDVIGVCGCGNGSDFAIDPTSGDIYVATGQTQVQKFSPTGTLRDTWPADGIFNIAVDSQGDVYVDSGQNPQFADTVITKYSPTGQQLATIDADQNWDMAAAGALAVDAQGRIYTTTGDTVRMFDSSGQMIAVWQYPAGSISLDAGGDVYTTGPGPTVTRFSGFLNPLPAIPPRSDSPGAHLSAGEFPGMYGELGGAAGTATPTLTLNYAAQSAMRSVSIAIRCTGSVAARCAGRLAMESPVATGSRSARVTVLGTKTFSIRAGQRASETIRLSVAARRLLESRARLSAMVFASYRVGSSFSTVSRQVVLRGQRRAQTPRR